MVYNRGFDIAFKAMLFASLFLCHLWIKNVVNGLFVKIHDGVVIVILSKRQTIIQGEKIMPIDDIIDILFS